MNTPRIGIRYAARSDVGMLREGNEDSGYAGARLLAVADGMGGHVGGEIASATAIDTLRKLDADIPTEQLLSALEHAVRAANDRLHKMVESDPSLQGMGTTLTAMLWSGQQVALAHIGDSRAYLLRNGELFQITHDHTLVQSLVDEGRISLDEAATHPQRSLLLRALDGRNEVEPDLSLREAQLGDRYLLCSDGLSGVVSADTIHQVLTGQDTPDGAIRQLIDLANRGGGPDNITCVMADVVDLDAGPTPDRPLLVGAAANKAQEAAQEEQNRQRPADTPAQRAADLRDTLPQPALMMNGGEYAPPPSPAPAAAPPPYQHGGPPPGPPPQAAPLAAPPAGGAPRGKARRGRKATLLLGAAGVAGLLVIGAAFFGYKALNSGYYLRAEGGAVVVYEGSNDKVLGFDLSTKAAAGVQPDPKLEMADLTNSAQGDVRAKGITADSPAAIRKKIEKLREQVCQFAIAPDQANQFLGVVQGRDQADCTPKPVTKDPASGGELPAPEIKFLNKDDVAGVQEVRFPTLEEAVAKLTELDAQAGKCQERAGTGSCPR
ncbi:Stp1/IreP family PP2C-type Ser/Thr phosphatase [Actinocorallia sp. A-T 12471]|uniref:Stp1/IreP family PP2C-type Ser/Thr phosphatase n=1 Tax=Actinocorallia sp. A-T 12471 TaxID=3089813 RepID=UPI0029CD7F9B|nr:Stp1/IreP family PP2C-type Ser/Thr phosphatase [Actinocorallia sp. A-T 12471]MDX6742091.1 Stp1/IreP family PP2C-type Ser/Thr phosphatase [Actinocorallia sp. A-T 12471]